MINLNFKQAILSLDRLGLTDVILPFILIFSIMYAISASVKHIGGSEENNKLRVIISFVVSLLVIIPHVTRSYPRGMDVVQIINNSIPQVAMLIVGTMMALMLLGALGISSIKGHTGKHQGKIVIAAFVIVALIFWDNLNYGSIGRIPFLGWFSNGDVQAILIIFIVFGLIVKLIVGDEGSSKSKNAVWNKAYAEAYKSSQDPDAARAAAESAVASIK